MRLSPHFRAILQAFLVTFLWSTSWVLIRYALDEIPPLTFAGLRYTLAFLILLPALWTRKTRLEAIPPKTWWQLGLLGLVFYTLTQGGVFLSLKYLEAVTFSLMLNFTTLLVAIAGMFTLQENPSRWQWLGIIAFIAGALAYFYPLSAPGGGTLGLTIGGLTVVANALATLLGRSANRDKRLAPLVVTVISMGVGGLALLVLGLALQGLPPISLRGWAIIAWLGVVNTAFAFTLWNRTLQVLSAVESSIINNTMLVQIAVLAWVFLGERITLAEMGGLGLAMVGALLVQIARPE